MRLTVRQCLGGPPCKRCLSKKIECVPGRQEVNQSLSITVRYSLLPPLLSAYTGADQLLQMERKFIFEDGRRCFAPVRLCCYGLPLCSIPKQGRPRSDTVQTSDSVVSPSSAVTDNVRNQDNSHNAYSNVLLSHKGLLTHFTFVSNPRASRFTHCSIPDRRCTLFSDLSLWHIAKTLRIPQ